MIDVITPDELIPQPHEFVRRNVAAGLASGQGVIFHMRDGVEAEGSREADAGVVDKRKLILPEAIKTLGEYTVPLKLHREVTVPLKVRVVKEGAAAPAAAPVTPATE